MQARSSRWGMGMDMGMGRGRAFATSLLGLWATINQAPYGSSLSSDMSCPTEGIICTADEVCNVCIDTLQSLSASSLSLGSTSGDCSELFVDLCNVVQETVCDATNEKFIALAACIVEDATGCTGFSSCEEVLSASPAPSAPPVVGAADNTSAPTALPTVMLAESPGAMTPAPTGLDEVAEVADAASGAFGLTASVATTVGVGLISGVGLLFLTV